MITLRDYIRESFSEEWHKMTGMPMPDYGIKLGLSDEFDIIKPYYKQFIEDYNTNNINNINIYNTDLDTFYNIISENLISHNTDIVIKRLQKEYPDLIYNKFGDSNISSIKVSSENIELLRMFYTDEKVINILLFHNYYITSKYYYITKDENYISIEPLYPQKINNEIEDKGNNVLYHICNLDKVKGILKCGLRCKPTDGKKRVYPSRIYCLFLNHNNLYNKANKELLKKAIIELGMDINYIHIFKINLHHKAYTIRTDFYKDEFMKDLSDNCCFTYNNIPPSCIEDITTEKLINYLRNL